MLSRKAQSEWIVRAYHSGLPAMIRELWPRHEPLRIALDWHKAIGNTISVSIVPRGFS